MFIGVIFVGFESGGSSWLYCKSHNIDLFFLCIRLKMQVRKLRKVPDVYFTFHLAALVSFSVDFLVPIRFN